MFEKMSVNYTYWYATKELGYTIQKWANLMKLLFYHNILEYLFSSQLFFVNVNILLLVNFQDALG